MDDRTRVHQRPVKPVRQPLDGRKGPAEQLEGLIGAGMRKHAGRKTRRAGDDGDFLRSLHPGQPWQGTGLTQQQVGGATLCTQGIHDHPGAETARRHQDALTVGQVRGHGAGNVHLCHGRAGHQDQFRPLHRVADVRRHRMDRHVATACRVRQTQRALRHQALQGRRITPPEADLVPLFRQVGGGGMGAVPTAEDGNPHAKPGGGTTPPSAFSRCRATCSAERSSMKLATTCTPTGKPASVRPTGTTVAGR